MSTKLEGQSRRACGAGNREILRDRGWTGTSWGTESDDAAGGVLNIGVQINSLMFCVAAWFSRNVNTLSRYYFLSNYRGLIAK